LVQLRAGVSGRTVARERNAAHGAARPPAPRGTLFRQDPQLPSLGDCLRSAGDIELGVDVGRVPLHRAHRQEELGGRFRVDADQPAPRPCVQPQLRAGAAAHVFIRASRGSTAHFPAPASMDPPPSPPSRGGSERPVGMVRHPRDFCMKCKFCFLFGQFSRGCADSVPVCENRHKRRFFCTSGDFGDGAPAPCRVC